MAQLAVVFRDMKTNENNGMGYFMPSVEFFENIYIPKYHPNAVKLDDNKYRHDNQENLYMTCEEVYK